MKEKKGITLIALVVTIIVILILAGVAIATLTGDNGLLQKAQIAKENSTEGEIEEEIRLAWNKVYTDSSLNSVIDKERALKEELDKTGHTDENTNITLKGKKIIIENYRDKTKELDIENGIISNPKPIIGVEYATLKVGDYVNYPVFYNNVGTVDSSGSGSMKNYPRDEYNGWRILSIDVENKEVKLVSAGVPLNYYHYDNAATTVNNLTTNFFNTSINSNLTREHFYQCGFKQNQNSASTISNMEDVKDLFTNNYTQINDEIPKVQIMTKSELDAAKEAVNSVDYKSNDLLVIPCKGNEYGEYAATWLASALNSSWVWYTTHGGGTRNSWDYLFGARPVVYLKSNIKFVENVNKINNTTTYDIYE